MADGEPVLRADVHRARPGVAAAGRAGAAADGGARRLPHGGRRALHPPHAAAAHRAARLALAAAGLRRALLLPLLQVTHLHLVQLHYSLNFALCTKDTRSYLGVPRNCHIVSP